MKRNFLQAITTHAAPISASAKPEVKMTLAATRAAFIAVAHGDMGLRQARAYIRQRAPKMSQRDKTEIDRAVVEALAKQTGIKPIKARSNAVYSGLTFPTGAACYFTLGNIRKLLNAVGGGKKPAKAASKAHRASPKEAAKKFAKAHPDAGYLMTYAQQLMREATALVSKSK